MIGCCLLSSLLLLLPLQASDLPWAWQPIEYPVPPAGESTGKHGPIDAFIVDALEKEGLRLSRQANKLTLKRRLAFNLLGFDEQGDAFLTDSHPEAFARQVDRLLASPRYGERWARHWLDVARFAETHGHDEDAIREHAWPYRDYVIQALNGDLPYTQFVQEQLAGDVLSPHNRQAIAATGFLAAGPWDESSQMGIQDGTIDKEIARYLDRDDMLSTVMLSFVSVTAHCARCHDHKFDPIPIEDYYALQAVFAGVDKTDRPLPNPEKIRLQRALDALGEMPLAGSSDDPDFKRWLECKLQQTTRAVLDTSTITSSANTQFEILDDGSVRCGGDTPDRDTYTVNSKAPINHITALGLELLTDPILPQKGPGRAENGNLHLSEIILRVEGEPVQWAQALSGFDQSGWTVAMAIDGNPDSAWGIHPQQSKTHRALFVLQEPLLVNVGTPIEVELQQTHGRGHVVGRFRLWVTGEQAPSLGKPLSDSLRTALMANPRSSSQTAQLWQQFHREQLTKQLEALAETEWVYAVASDFPAKGNFKPAIEPRTVHVLKRGNIHSPQEKANAGALSTLSQLPGRFALPDNQDEGARRAALAQWITDPNNPLTWRSIANRVWHYHFGQGLVSTPNDFGAMGQKPSHPELLDWLAINLRDHQGSLKWLHRTILASAVYQQNSSHDEISADKDANNALRWRMTPRRLDAESYRDAVLHHSGRLDLTMGGPSARQFLTKPGVHVTPVVDYLSFDPDHPANFRRSIYRFGFRTVPDPLMQALDCPDSSQSAPKRDESVTALQALAMMNNRFLVRQSEHWAKRLESESPTLWSQIDRLISQAYGRPAGAKEQVAVLAYARTHGLANACRIILNSNEFLFVN